MSQEITARAGYQSFSPTAQVSLDELSKVYESLNLTMAKAGEKFIGLDSGFALAQAEKYAELEKRARPNDDALELCRLRVQVEEIAHDRDLWKARFSDLQIRKNFYQTMEVDLGKVRAAIGDIEFDRIVAGKQPKAQPCAAPQGANKLYGFRFR